MSNNRNAALQFAKDNQDRFLDELIDLVKIPSVSTDPDHKADMRAAADWLVKKLTDIGIENVKIMETGGHPVVYGDYLKAGENVPTVVIYGHYDVQPPDPLDLWKTKPFEPTQEGDNLYGRGASDMKGQVMASLHAIESAMKNGGMPINIKFLLEGEEEVGSPNLKAFIEKNKDLFSCDFALNPDGGMPRADLPAILYALRGLIYLEINMTGPGHDLHSGMYGGAVLNPANELARLIGGMHDDRGRVTLKGFYDKVREIDQEERDALSRLPQTDKDILGQTGATTVYGEEGYTTVERIGARPTLDVNGLLSGFIGEGSKTVLPAKAMAKISMRLVPDQLPEDVERQLEEYLKENARPGVSWEVTTHSSAFPSITPRDSVGVKALTAALESVWGIKPVHGRVGGTIPVVAEMQNILGVDSVLTGFGLPDDNLHAPNEKISLGPWYKGIDALIHFFYNLA